MGGGLLYSAVTGESLARAIFRTWTFLSDPAAHASLESSTQTLLGFAMTILGMIICALLISIITDMVNERVALIKRGNSEVIEAGHTLILGYSEGNLRPLIAQIAIANESERGGVVVLLALKANDFLLKEVSYLKESDLKGTQVVVRSGSPLRVADLDLVSAQTARTVIVLADNGVSAAESDAVVMRTVLALSALETLDGHIVAELRDLDDVDHIQLISRHPIECVVAHDFIGRLMIQCARQRDLASVLDTLLGFDDDEIYIEQWEQLEGLTFAQVTRIFDFAIPIGIKRHLDAKIMINPSPSYIIHKQDEIIVLAEDNDTYAPFRDGPMAIVDDDIHQEEVQVFGPPRRSKCENLPERIAVLKRLPQKPTKPQNFLFLGWRRDVASMIRFLDGFLTSGSTLTIMSTLTMPQRIEELRWVELQSITLHHVVGSHVSRRQLSQLPLLWYDAILILSEKAQETNVLSTDSLTASSLVLVRDIQAQNQCPQRPPTPVLTDNAPTQQHRLCASTTDLVGAPPPTYHQVVQIEQYSTDSLSSEQERFLSISPSSDPKAPLVPIISTEPNSESLSKKQTIRSRWRNNQKDSSVRLDTFLNKGVSSDEEEELKVETPRTPYSPSRSRFNSVDLDPSVLTAPKQRRQSLVRSNTSNGKHLQVEKKKIRKSEKAYRGIKTQIITELLDPQMRPQLQRFTDVVASNEFISRILAMVSERAEVNEILFQLLCQRGTEILLRRVTDYANIGEKLNFYEISARAQLCGDIAIGFRCSNHNQGKFVLNPRDKLTYHTWSISDRIAVIGYDHTARKSAHEEEEDS
eukprot:CAMPEP_0197322528 /NCGR_PEP_ID=MMETSP0891-20130614/69952_1 /TAXON_ID=44058 ORGANISM="Aureoumbra lagunensis, Strain CCMP1510" /NCGR_SAMPLE_ID=MMETSP0891 /ASSEMBLY_ACC=CAM_ASM_000534 /LENGTH=809 /DNA_ID=CAMNT_0042814951 /DNA_START=242 /DNA_END=2671 /DNA_ORIENTATION=-